MEPSEKHAAFDLKGRRIFIIPEFSSFGGTRTYFTYLLDYYSRRGARVTALLSHDQVDNDIAGLLERHGCRAVTGRPRPRAAGGLLYTFPYSLAYDIIAVLPRLIRAKPDLIIVSTGTPALLVGLFMLPWRLIYILHTYPTARPHRRLWPIMKWLLRFSLGRNKRIATVSDYSVKNIQRHWLDGGESPFVSRIYNHAGKPREKTSGKKRKRLRVLTVGNVAWYKNPELWVEVAAGVCARLEGMPVEFVWAGDGPLLERCREAVRVSGRRNIRFIGYYGGVEGLLSRSDVYFQPSVLENHSLSIIGAMNCSLPCVVSGAGGNPESVFDGVTGFVLHHEDGRGMAEKLVALLSHGGLRRKMGKAGRERYERLFCEKVWNERFTALNGAVLRP